MHGIGPSYRPAQHLSGAALSVPEYVNQLRPIFEIFFRATPLLTLIQAAAAADDVPCETVIGSLREPSNFAGLPVVTDDGVRLEPPAWAKRLQAGAPVDDVIHSEFGRAVSGPAAP